MALLASLSSTAPRFTPVVVALAFAALLLDGLAFLGVEPVVPLTVAQLVSVPSSLRGLAFAASLLAALASSLIFTAMPGGFRRLVFCL